MTSQFAFCTCQPGAEAALKGEVAARIPDWRFAFSRPGFVTFRLPKPVGVQQFEPPRLTFARTTGLSIERLTLDHEAGEERIGQLAELVWAHDSVKGLVAAGPVALHVWQRDTVLSGEDGIEPGPTALSIAAAEVLCETAPPGAVRGPRPVETEESTGNESLSSDPANPTAGGPTPTAPPRPQRGQGVALDVVLVEPTEWWIGAHALRSRTDRWPGGVPRIELPEEAVSRAYLKLKEGLRWSAMPAKRGDRWIELGCAPGGSSQALLDAGMSVVGVDPAEVDPVVLAHPRFHHVPRRSAETSFDELRGAHWLAADINAAPMYTLEAVEEIATHASMQLRGLLLTIKLLGPDLARPERISEAIAKIRSWGFTDVRARQLAFNRREYCIAALRTRGQRRMARGVSRTRKSRPGSRPG